jgi:hypothetical protein
LAIKFLKKYDYSRILGDALWLALKALRHIINKNGCYYTYFVCKKPLFVLPSCPSRPVHFIRTINILPDAFFNAKAFIDPTTMNGQSLTPFGLISQYLLWSS